MDAEIIAAMAEMLYMEIKHPLVKNTFRYLVNEVIKPEDKFRTVIHSHARQGMPLTELSLNSGMMPNELPVYTRLVAATILAHQDRAAEFLSVVNQFLGQRIHKSDVAYVAALGLLRAYVALMACGMPLPNRLVEVYLQDFLFDHDIPEMDEDVRGDQVNIVAAFVKASTDESLASLKETLAVHIEEKRTEVSPGARQILDNLTHKHFSRLDVLQRLRYGPTIPSD